MSTTWILIANASFARLYANHGLKKGLQLVKEFAHPQSRGKGLDLVTDRPGHNAGAGNGHGSFIPATDPKQNEANRFALELAKELEKGRAEQFYDRLILVASAPFIGLLNNRFSNHVRSMITDTVERDYTRFTPQELSGRLAHCIYL
jgi:protein required for attachment to host cells